MFTKQQEFLAEVAGTAVLIIFGCGVVAMVVLFPDSAKGNYTNITIGWGLAVTFGIYTAGKISGAHLNPAVTLGLAVTGRFPKEKIWYYVLGQLVGAFIGAAIVFGVYYTHWIAVDPDKVNTIGIFCTSPWVPNASYLSLSGLFDQIVGTGLLVAMILAVGDSNNTPPGSNMSPLIVGLIVVAVGISFGGMHGYAINPARDLGPRLFGVVAGFSGAGFAPGSAGAGNWIVPIVGPLIGGVLGAIIYDFSGGKFMKSAYLFDPNNKK